ncbi:MAG: dihydrolipoyl dehydrogenase [Gammaproteobacteria bacterium]
MNTKKLILIGLVGLAVIGFFIFDLHQFLTLEYLQSSLERFHAYYAAQPVLVASIFFTGYVVITAVSLPGAAIMTLAAGALFGLVTGIILVSFASTIGATLAFLIARYILRDSVQQRFGDRLKRINAGIEKDGALYLFTLRLVPAFPFFLINILMALTTLKAWTFYWVSQLGMLAGTIVYVNAGTQLAQVSAVGDLLTPGLIGAFILLGIFPWIARAIVNRIQTARVYRPWQAQKPKSFDRNLIVIGAGSAGLVTSYIAAMVKARVTLIEKHKMGGDCLNTGCVPSKALIRTSGMLHEFTNSESYGINPPDDVTFDFSVVMQRIQRVIKKIAPHDSVERYSKLGVDCRSGEARLLSPWEVEIRDGDKVDKLTTKHIVIASGAQPFVPPIPGIEATGYLTSNSLWELDKLPERLIVLGGGPIGCELAQSFARLGSQVTLVEMQSRLLPREDDDASALVHASLSADGVELLLNHKAINFEKTADGKTLQVEHDDGKRIIQFDDVLVAVGRRANTTNLGLDTLGIELNSNGTLKLNDYLQTRYPNILGCGDVAGPYQFTHTAAHQAWFAAVNALFGRFKKFAVDYSVIPWATFTDPEVAHVGLNETEAREKNIAYESVKYNLDDLDRAITDGTDHGFVKVLTAPGSDRILGVTIVGSHAGDLIAEYVLAMKNKIGLNKILGTIHIYPTMAEANKYAAGEWKRAHAPERVLALLERFHQWSRN